MRRFLGAAIAAVFYLVSDSFVHAEDPAAAAVLDKAINALGGREQLAKAEAFSWTARWIQGGLSNFESQTTMQGLDHRRMETGNDRLRIIQVVSGDKGWARHGNVTRKLMGEELAFWIQDTYLEAIPITLLAIQSRRLKCQAADDEQVSDKPAAVLKITGPDGKDFALYFDKDSGLPVKEVAKMSGYGPAHRELLREVTFADYKDFNGIKKATKVEFKTNVRISHVLEVTEFKILEKVDPKTFVEPQ
jgi:negative regulator of sigma E activity